jgi:hypothetical protein
MKRMSRIEEALENAIRLRSIREHHEQGSEPAKPVLSDIGINILVISSDQGALRLISHLQPLLQAEIIGTSDIVQGIRYFFDKMPVDIDDHELRFAASMLDNLCCCYRRKLG